MNTFIDKLTFVETQSGAKINKSHYYKIAYIIINRDYE